MLKVGHLCTRDNTANLHTPLTPREVPILGDPCGRLHEVKFNDHDLADHDAFSELAPALYFDTIHEDDGITVVPQHWVCGLARSRLLNLLRMPHFGRYNITDHLAHQLLALIHNGCLWIRKRVPIDATLIHKIIGLPMQGPHPLVKVGKKYEAATAMFVLETYAVQQNQ